MMVCRPVWPGRCSLLEYALLDERRWQMLRADPDFQPAAALYDGLRPIETVLTPDQIARIDRGLGLGLAS